VSFARAKRSRLAGGSFLVPCRDLFARAKDTVAVAGPFLLDDARAVHVGYWVAE
jgi:hypothetical protein